MFDLTSMQDATGSCHYPEPVGEPLRQELNFTFPLEHITELIVLGDRVLQLTTLVLLRRISKMDVSPANVQWYPATQLSVTLFISL